MEVVERLFLNWIGREGRDRAVNQCHEPSVSILPSAAPPSTAGDNQAPPFAGVAPDSITYSLLQERIPNELGFHLCHTS